MTPTWIGSIQNASTNEISSAVVTTKGITNMNLPMIPGISISGMNAAAVVATEVNTGAHTSRTPSMAAAATSWPRCTR